MGEPLANPRPISLAPRLALLLGLAGLVGAFYLLGGHHYLSWAYIRANVDAWKAFVDDNRLLCALGYFLLYVGITALSLPAAGLLSLLAGALFGRWLGTGLVSIAATLGATLAFLAARYLFRDWVQSRLAGRLERLNRGIEREGVYYLFVLRLVPVVPFFLVNIGMALTPIRLLPYVVVSWAGMLLPGFLYVNAGTELGRLDSPSGLLSWPLMLSLAALGLTPLLLRRLLSGLRGTSAPNTDEGEGGKKGVSNI
jgi:uncharacterized membrane protein YdjX (TVP38/TMEM64 family)